MHWRSRSAAPASAWSLQLWGERQQLWSWPHRRLQKPICCDLTCPRVGLHRSDVHICVCMHICVCTLVGGSQPPKDQSFADSFTQLLNSRFANYSYSKARNTMIKQLCLSRARKHVTQQEALILDTGMEKPDTLPLLSMTAGGGRTQKLCVSRQPRGDVKHLPIPPSLLITRAESLSHLESKSFVLHPGNKTTGGEGGLLETIGYKTNHKSGRWELLLQTACHMLARSR